MNKVVYFQNNKLLAALSLLCLCIGLFNALMHPVLLVDLPELSEIFMLVGLGLAVLFNILMFKHFIAGFLFAVFFGLISSRLSALYDLYSISTPIVIAVGIMIIHYVYNVVSHLMGENKNNFSLSLAEYQLIFLRMYVGFDLIPHFTEKLLAGSVIRLEDVNAFIHLGVPHPEFFVILAGFCELGGVIALGLGLFTRLGAVLTALYLLIATILGKHFMLGFIWAGAGGGWEYPLMWIVLVLVFAVSGGNKFSLDALLVQRYQLPKFVKMLMGQ